MRPTCRDCALAAAEADPLSKDALFGDRLGRRPESRGVKVQRLLRGLGAYTYADPTHWSRGVGRLSLAAQGEFAET